MAREKKKNQNLMNNINNCDYCEKSKKIRIISVEVKIVIVRIKKIKSIINLYFFHLLEFLKRNIIYQIFYYYFMVSNHMEYVYLSNGWKKKEYFSPVTNDEKNIQKMAHL